MFTYRLSLYTKHDKSLIDTKLYRECENRDVAMERVKWTMLCQGLSLSNYKISLKKVKE